MPVPADHNVALWFTDALFSVIIISTSAVLIDRNLICSKESVLPLSLVNRAYLTGES